MRTERPRLISRVISLPLYFACIPRTKQRTTRAATDHCECALDLLLVESADTGQGLFHRQIVHQRTRKSSILSRSSEQIPRLAAPALSGLVFYLLLDRAHVVCTQSCCANDLRAEIASTGETLAFC
jgi:hypothetical protein